MPNGSSGVMKYVILWFRIFFGAHLLYSALRYYIGFAPMAHITHPVAGPFVDALTATGIYHVVKTIELITGAMILFNIFVPLALVIEFPISVVIMILNFFVVASGRQLFSGPQELILNGLLLIFYGRYYAPMFRMIASPKPLWTITGVDIAGR
jgi:hypothetical protein